MTVIRSTCDEVSDGLKYCKFLLKVLLVITVNETSKELFLITVIT